MRPADHTISKSTSWFPKGARLGFRQEVRFAGRAFACWWNMLAHHAHLFLLIFVVLARLSKVCGWQLPFLVHLVNDSNQAWLGIVHPSNPPPAGRMFHHPASNFAVAFSRPCWASEPRWGRAAWSRAGANEPHGSRGPMRPAWCAALSAGRSHSQTGTSTQWWCGSRIAWF